MTTAVELTQNKLDADSKSAATEAPPKAKEIFINIVLAHYFLFLIAAFQVLNPNPSITKIHQSCYNLNSSDESKANRGPQH